MSLKLNNSNTMVKEYIKKDLVSKYFEDDRKLTEYVSEALNIHSERLSIIEKNACNSEKKVITKDQLILIVNSKLTTFRTLVSFKYLCYKLVESKPHQYRISLLQDID